MTVKLAILKSGENIIADVKEGFYEERLVCYILENPCSVSITGTYKILDQENNENQYSISLSRWPTLSKDTIIKIVPDWIISLVEPVDNLKKLYTTQVLGIIENDNDQSISIIEQSDSNQSD